jgi:tRNA A-37 threonylcarbamoyl transferase component Bud32
VVAGIRDVGGLNCPHIIFTMDYLAKVLAYFDKERAVRDLIKRHEDGLSIKMVCNEIGKSHHWVRPIINKLLKEDKIVKKKIGGINVYY